MYIMLPRWATRAGQKLVVSRVAATTTRPAGKRRLHASRFHENVSTHPQLSRLDTLQYFTDLSDKKTMRFLEQESRLLAEYGKTNQNSKLLFREAREYLPPSHVEVPERFGKGAYFSMHDEEEELGAMCRLRDASLVSESELFRPSSSTVGFQRLLDMRTIADEVFGSDGTDHIEFLRLGEVKLSQDEERIAFTMAFNAGDETFQGFIKDIDTGYLLGTTNSPVGVKDDVLNGINNIELDNMKTSVVYYTDCDPITCRPHKVFRRVLGTPRSSDVLLFHETDPHFSVDLCSTKSGDCLIISSHSKSTSEVRILPHGTEEGTYPVIVQAREPGIEYFVEKLANTLIVVSNVNSHELELYQVPFEQVIAGNGGSDCWVPIPILKRTNPHEKMRQDNEMGQGETCGYSPDTIYNRQIDQSRTMRNSVVLDSCDTTEFEGIIEELDAFMDHLVLYVRNGAATSVLVGNWSETYPIVFDELQLPSWCTCVEPGNNSDFKSKTLRLKLSSLVHPQSAWDAQLDNPKKGVTQCALRDESHQQQPFAAKDRFVPVFTETRNARDKENTENIPQTTERFETRHISVGKHAVPVSITQIRDHPERQDQPVPLLLKVYGAYGHNLPLGFSPVERALLDRGWAIAGAHVRGGGERGRQWYHNGKLDCKWNSFTDFITVSEYLVDQGITTPELLTARAHSAGCLTLGVACNIAPELFRAMVLNMPFLDVLSTMLDETLPLTVAEYEEWGNPSLSREVFEYIASYDPILNINGSNRLFPDVYVTASLEDVRVPYWGPAKWVATVRSEFATAETTPALVFDVTSDSHFGAGGRLMQLEEEAKSVSFLLNAVETPRKALQIA